MAHIKGFEAVVLAGGKGSRMMELTAGKPKCLLPVGNFPMIWYPLQLLEKAGFDSVHIIVLESSKSEISSALDKLSLKIKLEYLGVSDDDLGTADSMRLIYDKIKKDCVVVSCDLIANVNLGPILDLYLENNASLAALTLPVPKIPENRVIAGPKNKQKQETDLIGVEPETNRLVFFASAADFEECILLPSKLTERHSHFNVHSDLLDAHLYIMNTWVLKFLSHNKNFISIKGDLLPYIISKQLAKTKKNVADKNSIAELDVRDGIQQYCTKDTYDETIREMTGFGDGALDMLDSLEQYIRCFAFLAPEECGLRANTVPMYSLANATIENLWNNFQSEDSRICPTATVKSTQVQECRIDSNTFIDEKTSLKQSVIGCKVTVEPKTRIVNSIIMDNVTIKQKCVITNSILCNGCVIEEGAVLKNCLVGAKYTVPGDQEFSHEILTGADELMEI